jgi:Class-II DAHP synthetase family
VKATNKTAADPSRICVTLGGGDSKHASNELLDETKFAMSPSSATSEKTVGDNAKAAVSEWSPSSWRKRKAKQQPVYADAIGHQKALEKLETLPPLVTVPEVAMALKLN